MIRINRLKTGENMKRIITYALPIEYRGHKIIDFFIDKGYSRQNIKALKFTESGVFKDGVRLKMDYLVQGNEIVEVRIIESEASERIPAVKLPLNIVYEDQDVLVVNKPSDMPIHPSLNNYENTLGNAVAYYYKEQGEEFIFRCINRLDRDTTGLVLIAKNMISCSILSDEHKNNIIQKEYTAIVEGLFEEKTGRINMPIGRTDDSIITRTIDYENGDVAITNYTVVKSKNDLSLIRLNLETGRTHQIRVHMKAIGHPLIGDFLYNPHNKLMQRQALHVNKLSFRQPITNEYIELTADYPEDMATIIKNHL